MSTTFPSAGNLLACPQTPMPPTARVPVQKRQSMNSQLAAPLAYDVFFAAKSRKQPQFPGKGNQYSWLKPALLGLMMLGGAHASSRGQGQTDATAMETQLHSRDTFSEILKCPPFAPTNHSLFSPSVYSDSPSLQLAPTKAVNESEITAELSKMFSLRFPQDKKAATEALALFNQPELKSWVLDPRLRGALVSLQGTLAESAIEVVKNGTFAGIGFSDLGKNIIAARVPDPAGFQKPKLLFNTRYEHEDFRQLAPYFAHEVLHDDELVSAREERINHALASLVYGQLIYEDHALARSGTELSRRQNTEFKARLDSRDTDGNLRLFTSQGNVYPGCDPGKELANYGAAFTQIGPDTPNATLVDSSLGSEALRRYVELATGLKLSKADFDELTEQNLDQHQAALKPEQLIGAAEALQLNTTCEKNGSSNNSPEPSGSSTGPEQPAVTSGGHRNLPVPGVIRGIATVGKKIIEWSLG